MGSTKNHQPKIPNQISTITQNESSGITRNTYFEDFRLTQKKNPPKNAKIGKVSILHKNREESAFDPLKISSSGSIGLTCFDPPEIGSQISLSRSLNLSLSLCPLSLSLSLSLSQKGKKDRERRRKKGEKKRKEKKRGRSRAEKREKKRKVRGEIN